MNTFGINNIPQLINKPVFNAGKVNNAPQKPANTYNITTIDTSSMVGPTGIVQLKSYMGNYVYIPAPLSPLNTGFTGTLKVILPTDAEPGYYLTIGTNVTSAAGPYAMKIAPPDNYSIAYQGIYPAYISSTGANKEFNADAIQNNQYNLILSDTFEPGTTNRLYTISY